MESMLAAEVLRHEMLDDVDFVASKGNDENV